MLPTIFETAPINYISPRISNNDNLVPSPSFKELSSSRRNKKIDNNIMDPTGGGREIAVEGDKVYIPNHRRVFDDDQDEDDDDESSSSMTTNIMQIDLDDVPDLPFCPADRMPSEQEELHENDDDDGDDDMSASCSNDINFVRHPRPILRSSTTPTDTLTLLQRQQQNDQVRKQARTSLLYSSSSSSRSPRSVVTNVLHLSSENSAGRDVQNILASRPAAA